MPDPVADLGTNAILLRATLDLADLCDAAGLADEARVQRERAQQMKNAMPRLWNDDFEQYVSLDTRSGEQLPVAAHATFLAGYARLHDAAAAENTTRCSNAGLRNHALHWPRCAPTHPTTNRSATGAARSGRMSTG